MDAIHTNAGQLGIWQNVGQVDFYINGGSGPQPGCYAFDSLKSAVTTLASTVAGNNDRIPRNFDSKIGFN